MLPLLLSLLFVLLGCSKRVGYAPSSYGAYPSAADRVYEEDGAFADLEVAKRSARAEMAPMLEAKADAGVPPPAPPPPPEPQGSPTKPAPARMVHYDGYARLRVGRLEEGIDRVRAVAEARGGHVEQVSGRRVVVRVPVEAFRAAFDEVLALGEVLDQSLSAQDVTDAFTAVDLRLKTAEATRARLQALLARSEDEQEKLQLIRQIQRLTEEIDRLTAQVRTLAALASLSRISVDLEPREALAWQGPEDDLAELAWIRRLSPLRSEPPLEARKLELPVPDGMVRLSARGPWVVEASDGARAWAWKAKNEPLGDADYWLAALQSRLAREFASAEATSVGAWRVLRLVDRPVEGGGEGPFSWLIAVRVEGDRLQVFQAMTPDPASFERHRAALERVLGGGAS